MVTWTGIVRREHSREGLRYPSDMTDDEGALAAPFVPPTRRGGRPGTADMCEVLDAMLYVAASGCARRLLPICFPPVSTGRRYFYAGAVAIERAQAEPLLDYLYGARASARAARCLALPPRARS